VTLVTGSSQGIGRATARELARRGHHVHVVTRDAGRAAALEGDFPGRTHRADLVESAACADLVAGIVEADGRLDHVVHAVGDFQRATLEATGWDEWQALLDSNLRTSVQLADAARAPLRSSSGSLLFFGVAGLDGHRARRATAAYAAAKSALLVLTRSLAAEEAGHGVRVNMLSPGVVPHVGAEEGTRAADGDGARVPLGPSTPEELARTVAWLLSADARSITGQNLEQAGGWML